MERVYSYNPEPARGTVNSRSTNGNDGVEELKLEAKLKSWLLKSYQLFAK